MYRLNDEEEAEDRLFLAGFDRIEQRSQQRAHSETRRKRIVWVLGAVATLLAVVIIVSLSVGLARRAAQPYSCKNEAGAQYEVNFFVIGDWGRQGSKDQRQVARMMADVAQCMQPAFVISTGDNFYDSGLKSPSDPNFQQSFQDVYNQPALQENWYAVLGNHDYGGGIDPTKNTDCAALSLESCPTDCCYSSVWQFTGRVNDIRWHCQNGTYTVPTGNGALMDILMIDTSPFIPQYLQEAWGRNAGGILQQNSSQIKEEVRAKLAASKAKWKLAVGHHPIASYGKHCEFSMAGDCQHMEWLETELQAAKTAAYFCGHEHDLQYVTKLSDAADTSSTPQWPVYVVSGAGSEVRNNEFNNYKQQGAYAMRYMADDQGFVAARANWTHLVMHYYAASRTEPVYSAVLAHP